MKFEIKDEKVEKFILSTPEIGSITEYVKAKPDLARSFGQFLKEKSKIDPFVQLVAMTADTANYDIDENELNEMGYEFYKNGKKEHAFESLRAAIFLFPKSDNLYDSYGELLAKSGKKEEAIIMYKKSIALNPKSENSIRALEKLEKK